MADDVYCREFGEPWFDAPEFNLIEIRWVTKKEIHRIVEKNRKEEP